MALLFFFNQRTANFRTVCAYDNIYFAWAHIRLRSSVFAKFWLEWRFDERSPSRSVRSLGNVPNVLSRAHESDTFSCYRGEQETLEYAFFGCSSHAGEYIIRAFPTAVVRDSLCSVRHIPCGILSRRRWVWMDAWMDVHRLFPGVNAPPRGNRLRQQSPPTVSFKLSFGSLF